MRRAGVVVDPAARTVTHLVIEPERDHGPAQGLARLVPLDHADATTAIFRLTGRMTLGMRLREVESRITEVADKGAHKLILELSGVEFLDSAGLGLLMIFMAFWGAIQWARVRKAAGVKAE